MRARDWSRGVERGWDRRRGPLAALVALAAAVLLVTGVVVTAAGPHSGDDDVTKRFGDLLLATQVHVRAAVDLHAARRSCWWRGSGARAAPTRLTGWLAALAVPLIALQIGIGEYQYRHGLPWQVVGLHVTTAALVWAVILAACWGVARPAPSAGYGAPGGDPLAGDAAHGVGQRPEPALRDLRAAVHADPVGPRLDRRERGAQALLALAPAQLLAQVALAQVGVGRGLGRVVVRVAALLAVARQVALLERGHHLLAQPRAAAPRGPRDGSSPRASADGSERPAPGPGMPAKGAR